MPFPSFLFRSHFVQHELHCRQSLGWNASIHWVIHMQQACFHFWSVQFVSTHLFCGNRTPCGCGLILAHAQQLADSDTKATQEPNKVALKKSLVIVHDIHLSEMCHPWNVVGFQVLAQKRSPKQRLVGWQDCEAHGDPTNDLFEVSKKDFSWGR